MGGVRVTPFHVVHDDRAGPCLGLRIEAEGKVIAFSGDTEWTDALIDIGREADLFICEAYTRDKPIRPTWRCRCSNSTSIRSARSA